MLKSRMERQASGLPLHSYYIAMNVRTGAGVGALTNECQKTAISQLINVPAPVFVIVNIPFQEYALTSIFLLRYTKTMKTLWTALTEPNRLHIVELLRDGPLTVGEITERLGLQQPQASKHLKVLSEAGVVEVQPQANRRIYQLRREPFHALETWRQD